MTATKLTIGTRRSRLARVQTDLVAAAIKSIDIAIHAMDPLGDRDKTTALYKLSDGTAAKSLWTGELEELLEKKELDVIVHSLKDMPTTLPAGLVLAAVLKREDARDALILKRTAEQTNDEKRNAKAILENLPDGAVIGTSSLRRMAQLRTRYPQFKYEVVRGNVETRIRKLDSPGEFENGIKYAALILAAAGLIRLNLGDRINAYLTGDEEHGGVLHAVGQGAIGIEAREDVAATRKMLSEINHRETWHAVLAERALLRALEGGCSVPIGVETSWKDGKTLVLKAAVVSVDGRTAVEAEDTAVVDGDVQAEELGARIAKNLVKKGASVILDAINAERKREREDETTQEKIEHAVGAGIV